MNPALLLNPKGKNFDSESMQPKASQPRLGSNGFDPGANRQPNLSFEFSNTDGNGFDMKPNGEYQSASQYSNSNHFSPSNPPAAQYSMPYMSNMADALPKSHSPLNGMSNLPMNNSMGSMIERINNVQDRSTVPLAKRQKLMDSDNEGFKNGFSSGSSGMLSAYVKDKQRTGVPTGNAQATLDLTGGMYSRS